MKLRDLKNVTDFISSKASDVLKSSKEPEAEVSKEKTEAEELEHYERMLSAERQKTERAVKKQREKVEELTPKNFFSKMVCDEEKLEQENNKLDKLEERLIELNNMNAKDLLIESKSCGGNVKGMNWSDTKKDLVASILETAGDFVPVPGVSVATKIISGIIKK